MQAAFLALLLALFSAHGACAQVLEPGFSKSFTPGTIGPGSTSVLEFQIDNSDSGSPVADLAFTDTLPAALTIASSPNASTTCGGSATLTAPAGGTTITFADGTLGAFDTCTVAVNVTGSTPGTHTNVSGDLTSSAGNSGNATADLTIATTRPGFSKAFSPSSIGLGAVSTLIFTIDNSANGSLVSGLSFNDDLPSGMEIASPANASNTCNGTLTAGAGTSNISLFNGFVPSNSTCTVSVNVTGTTVGSHQNVSGDLTTSAGNSGSATNTLTVTSSGELLLTKAFTDDPVIPGDTVTLRFTMRNTDRDATATGIAFTDNLDATLTGLTAVAPLPTSPCGAGSTLTGTSLLNLSGGTLAPSDTCTFDVTLQVPAGASSGAYPNTTSPVSADGGLTGDPASDNLNVQAGLPLLTKTFTTNPVLPEDTVTVEFTITNQSTTSTATAISFTDDLSAFIPGTQVASLPASGFCGAGSSIGFNPGSGVLSVGGGSLAASDSCTFSVDLTIPSNTPGGSYLNATSEISATVDSVTLVGFAASDSLTVEESAGSISFSKNFSGSTVPGGTTTLEFELTNNNAATATDIAFTDDLGVMLGGTTATGFPADPCGAGSSLGGEGTGVLSLAGGSLASGESCTFAVTVNVDGAAPTGDHVNTTSVLTATVGGVPSTGSDATDTLTVLPAEPPVFTKSFTDDPVIAGGTVTLEFTIDNSAAGTGALTDMVFIDNLGAVLSGLQAVAPLPATPCGAGSTISGTTDLTFSGGNLPTGGSCTFSVTLQVPGGAASGDYGNATSNLVATINGSGPIPLSPATDTLSVDSDILLFSKAFTDDPIPEGGTGTLRFTIENISSSQIATNIAFTDDLDAALSGLVSVSGTLADVCGAGSQISGSTNLTLSGGNLPAGGSCTFDVTLQVPDPATTGNHTNTTSQITGLAGGLPVSGLPATDDLTVVDADAPTFSKSFVDDPVGAGGTVTLRFTIDNPATGGTVSSLAFSDDLDAVVPGLAATGLPATDMCGTGSQISGAGTLAFTGGNLDPGESCTFDVTLQVPAGAAAGSFTNTTSDLSSGGLFVTSAASDDLQIEPPPSFAKVFAPDSILVGEVSTLTFTIDNSAAVIAATNLDFIDNLPAAVTVASTPNPATTCTGGTITAASGASVISYSGGTVGAGASCTVSVDVTALAVGSHVNTTGDLTSSLGNSGTASDTLDVGQPTPDFSKAFSPASIVAGGVTTLTFTIDNTDATVDATALDFTDSMPPPMIVARNPNASTTCIGGTLSATSGSGVVSYSGGMASAGASCTVSVDVTVVDPGSYDNVSGDLTSSLGNSGPATDTLEVTIPGNPPPLFSKAFAPDTTFPGDISTLTFTIDNGAATLDAADLDFTDNLPASVVIAGTPNAATTCTGGTLTAPGGGTQINYTGGTVAGGAACAVSVDVTAEAAGRHDNISGDLTSSLGNSGSATATLNAVSGAPAFSKAFSPDTIVAGEVSTLTFTIDNTAATLDATGLDFTDPLPGTVVVAATPNASTTCTGGTLTAAAGDSSIDYSGGTVADGASCTVMVDVTTTDAGTYVNETGDLTSSLGNSGPATDTLTVNERTVDLSVTLVDDIDPIVSGNQLTYTADVSNAGPQAADNTVATVALAAGTTFVSSSGCAEDPNGVPTCGLGSIPAGGNASFSYTVLVDIGTSGPISSDVSVASDVTDTNPANNTASQSTTVNQASGTITVATNTAPAAAGDDTFEFTSPDADLDAISLTTVSNTATTDPIAKVAGSYVLNQDVPATWRLDAIECAGDTDGGSVVDIDENEVTIDLDDGEAIVCTFTNVRDEDHVIAETQGLIREFMEQRADQITSNSPDLVKRLRGRGGSGGTLGTLQGSANLLSSNFFFSSSLGEVKSFRNSLNGDGTTEPPKFDIWVDARFTHNKTDSSSTHFGLLYLGADYLVNPDLVIGGIVQLDWAGLDRNATNQSVDGFGWMAGPYFVARPWQDVYIDGRFAWGQSDNEVNPLGLYIDSFDTERWLASGRITGDYFHGGLRISPAAEVIYFHERQESYVDSLSITIPSQTVSLGRVVFGPEIAYEMQLASGAVLTPSLKFEGIWDFHRSDSVASSSSFTSTSELRARVGVGLGFVVPGGMSISASGFYDGIGASSYDTYGGKVEISVPLN